ncbi:hypothetical protein HLH33_13045 [Gluconacetobacter diazotrophicus]|uniref:CI repressor n=1 Tax=Gluconacetobacter diazotrophicus TaxID=33996 RepID=A0A7W4NGA7_GLUDI|nr:YdaS family helix-turn-helix protein [Gluconacetobacter diazotrophicus]MBB2157226.1 hypothetical protein [Gluconacetobacter diazotrophicus]
MDVSSIIKRAGGVVAVARAINRHPSTISGWRRVPAEVAVDVAQLAGLEPSDIRPDVFRDPKSLAHGEIAA